MYQLCSHYYYSCFLYIIRADASDFYVQEPSAYDELTGGISLPCVPTVEDSNVDTTTKKMNIVNTVNDVLRKDRGIGASFQFCVRSSALARQDLIRTRADLEAQLVSKSSADENQDPLALLMLGSMERGSKVFRYTIIHLATTFCRPCFAIMHVQLYFVYT